MKRKSHQVRVFSGELKQKIVKDIEQGKVTIAQVCREYSVTSASIYKWIHKYSSYLQKGVKLVMELSSEGYKSKELEKQVKDLEAALGRKQMEVEFLGKLIEITNKELGIDIKKKSYTPPSIGSESAPKKGTK
jgi:transposase